MPAGSEPIPIESVGASAFTIPTDKPESDGTMAWDSTTIVVVEAAAAGRVGLGWTYASAAAAEMIRGTLAAVVSGGDAIDVAGRWAEMIAAVRNIGRPGLASCAVSAVDTALWDLKARILDVPLAVLLGAVRDAVPVYGSGGFTTYGPAEVAEQLGDWTQAGIPRVKIKVGREPEQDPPRLDAARSAIGASGELYVDANGAFRAKEALRWSERYVSDHGVSWFEEPVSSDDLEGLRLVRERCPAGLDVAAGEYGYEIFYFRRMLAAGSVDCLQADVTRCGGYTSFLRVSGLCDAFSTDLSAHCAPQLSAHAGSAAWHFRHLEYFHDHVRIERMLFDGVLEPEPGGLLRPDRGRAGLGLELRRSDARRWAV
ncbi:MAG: enolase C-terminal domain-like protein [Acidimicrobiales bacterium]